MDINRVELPIPSAVAGLCAVVLALALGACSGEADARLSPPEGWRNAVRGQSQAAAEQARRTSQEVLRRSPAVIAPPLAQGIRFSRREALREDVRDMSPKMRATLAPYFSEHVLDGTRWTVAGQDLGAGTLLARWYYEKGAVTLRDVIVFSDEEVAGNIWLWAHELAHVEQYRRYGVDGFARRYAQDWRALEREANDRAFAITADIRAQRAARPGPMDAMATRLEDALSSDDPTDPAPAAEDLAPPGDVEAQPETAEAPAP